MARRRSAPPASFGDATSVSFLDQAMLLGVLMLFIVLVVMSFINEPPKGEAQERSEVVPTALYVQTMWTFNEPHDLDTYLQCTMHLAKKDVVASVNFKQKNSDFLDLIVDDLGKPSADNYERILSNSSLNQLLPNTICRLNVHLYSTHEGTLPLEGRFHVILNKDHKDGEQQLTPKDGALFILTFPGQELTLMELVIDREGKVYTEATSFYPEAPYRCIATCK